MTETLDNVSRHAVKRLLKHGKSQGSREVDDTYLCQIDLKSKLDNDFGKTAGVHGGGSSKNVANSPSGSVPKDELDDLEWEYGSVPKGSPNKHALDQTINGVTVEFDVSPSAAKQKSIRRATSEEKEVAELVHKVNLLCLLGRGRLVDSACNDPLIQASLLSILPTRLHKITEDPKLTAKALTPVVEWFHNSFHVRGPGSAEKPPHLALASALEAYEGTAEEVAALSVALFRALNLTARFVAILDAASLKPEVDKPESSSQASGKASGGIFNTSTLMVSRSGVSPVSPLTPLASNEKDNCHRTSWRSKGKAKKLLELDPDIKDFSGDDTFKDIIPKPSAPSVCQDGLSDAELATKTQRSKRKGDLEFEMQLEMAIAATAIESSKTDVDSDMMDVHDMNSQLISPSKKIKLVKTEDSPVSSSVMSTAIGSRKVGAPLYWAEVYCCGENLTGKWVHVDTVNAIIDGEHKVEAAAAACRKPLRYVVAFAGHGAKDVTRRYCMKWYKIASQRVNEIWWDAVLAPLKQLESLATGGIVHLEQEASTVKRKMVACEEADAKSCMTNSLPPIRSSLEDMELETRALTEPLPTNQQAYRNHKLYAIERWLNKYQILHPKGPVLGFCSGHPVYPRTCVQTLHTKERWMREGCQLKAGELPAKILKGSLKQNKEQAAAADDDEIVNGDHIALYGKWQTEPLCLPRAADGIVPKNERGQVDVWSEKCLPPGTVHLRLPRVAVVAKRLEVDFAPAMVGFEFRNGRSVPVFQGIVVCSEFKDAIVEAYNEEEDKRMAEEKRRNEVQALSRWYQLLSSVITRQRLNNRYGNGSEQESSALNLKPSHSPSSAETGDNESSRKRRGNQQNKLHDEKPSVQPFVPTEDHEHVFFSDDESFNDESCVRTKRCKCGFSIELEEL
ncbi:OLC1v1011585C1 [Oldenlandia corymbosa var. corymbosa]|uniref:OLC1v1011585C1 n=1 Tax=Oldenlandia corymbosa var. corymbosa TaxID=529605 RepID=A0AAV1DU18_OLDCO|nr:OLC1v1011585C1 [Oldenlandia corymbosa var. corymbosa]